MFVFKVYGEKERLTGPQCKYSLKRIMKELTDGGLQTRLFYSVQVGLLYSFSFSVLKFDRMMKFIAKFAHLSPDSKKKPTE